MAEKRLARAQFVSGDTRYLFVGRTEEEVTKSSQEAAKRLLRQGKTIEWPDGRWEWIEVRARRAGTDYVWHEDGNRIAVDRYRWIRSPEGFSEKIRTWSGWMLYDSYIDLMDEG